MRFQHWVSKDKDEGIMSLIGGGRCGAFRKSKKRREGSRTRGRAVTGCGGWEREMCALLSLSIDWGCQTGQITVP